MRPTLEYQLDDRRLSSLSVVHSLFHPLKKRRKLSNEEKSENDVASRLDGSFHINGFCFTCGPERLAGTHQVTNTSDSRKMVAKPRLALTTTSQNGEPAGASNSWAAFTELSGHRGGGNRTASGWRNSRPASSLATKCMTCAGACDKNSTSSQLCSALKWRVKRIGSYRESSLIRCMAAKIRAGNGRLNAPSRRSGRRRYQRLAPVVRIG